jgi:septum site-determining protein MinC
MPIDSPAVSNQRPAIEFKSTSFVAPALIINSTDLKDISAKIVQKTQQAPEFFKHSPVLLDINALSNQKQEIALAELIQLIRTKDLIPIALRGGNAEQNELALKAGLFIQPIQTAIDSNKSLQSVTSINAKPPSLPATDTSVATAIRSPIRADRRTLNDGTAASKIITTPIRSGQRVYSEGDLIIMAPVSAGAEIMAEGNIHVYGTLRGRALAGVLGKPDTRIFCFDCQAELVAIAGNYKLYDDLDQSMQHKPVQIYLQDQALIIKEL